MNETCISVGATFAWSPEVLTLNINNQLDGVRATASGTKHLVVIVDAPSNAELTAAAQQLFRMLDDEERDGDTASW